MLKDECSHSPEHRVHSISHRADEIDTPHLHTCTPSDESSFLLLLTVVLTRVLEPLGPLLLRLAVWCWLVALVLAVALAPPAPLLLLLAVWCWLVALVLAVVAPPAPLLLLLAVWCWLLLLFSHPWHLSCNASSPSDGGLLQTPHYRISTPLCLIKSLGLILQPAPLLLLLMVLTHDLDCG